MFLLIPALLGRGTSLATALVAACLLTVALYVMTAKIAPAFGVDLEQVTFMTMRGLP